VLDALEVGGGRSGLTALLYPEALVTNLDSNPALATAPPNLDPRVRFVHGDATTLPFGDSSFDLVTMFDVLEHVEEDDGAVREALRVLRPGGHLLITSPSEHWRFPYHRAMRGICPSEAEMLAEWAHVRRGYSLDDLRTLLGLRPAATASFISPVTVVCHDLAFSKLRGRIRRGLCALIAPVTWTAYWLHRPASRGTETASCWRKPD
jgi:SAM-dependent methyltransferase